MIVRFSAEAELEFEAIGDFIARDSPKRAVSFVQELRSRCMTLADTPDAFPLVPRYARQGVRRRVYGSYLIFYEVKADAVDILHILHGAQDYDAIF